MNIHKILCAVCIMGFSLISCGKKGPLTLEPPKLPLQVENFALRQVGNRIVAEWSFPKLLSDRKTPADSGRIGRISIFSTEKSVLAKRSPKKAALPKVLSDLKTTADSDQIGKISTVSSEKPVLDERFLKRADLLSRFGLAETQKTDNQTFTAAVPLKTKALKEKQYRIAMLYEYGKKRSALSAILPIKTMIPPRPVGDLKVSQENKVILLKWSKPAKDADDNPLPSILGYNVYRKIKVGKEETASRMLNPKPLQRELFEDSDSSQDGEYVYTVTTLLAEKIESDFSNPATIGIRDTFPPDIPGNLVTFTGADHVFLSWEPVKDVDLSHYRVYRKASGGDEFPLLADQIRDPFFKDTKAVKGTTYTYCVSAVDRKGNESALSKPAQHKFE
jgi:hypothetical protein